MVDDYFPTKVNKAGDLALAFAKTTKGENEIWMLLLEKAYAKICGSYEAMEKDISGPFEGEICQNKDYNPTGDPKRDLSASDKVGTRIDLNCDRSAARLEEVFGIFLELKKNIF